MNSRINQPNNCDHDTARNPAPGVAALHRAVALPCFRRQYVNSSPASYHLHPNRPTNQQFICLEPTSFCKCTCWTNSTIIPLGPPGSVAPLDPRSRDTLSFRDFISGRGNGAVKLPTPDGGEGDDEAKDHGGRSCNDCNRRFCLDQHLPKCKGAVEENVFTTCFREC